MRTPVLGVVALAVVPTVYGWSRGYEDLSLAVSLGVTIGAASLAFAFDDPAEESVSACPGTRPARRSVRVGLISAVVAVAWAVMAVAAHRVGHPVSPIDARLAEASAAVAVALSIAACASSRGHREPGLAAVAGTLLGFVLTTGFALRLTWLPQLGRPDHQARWWAVAAGAGALASWWVRDPAGRGVRPGRLSA